PAKVQEYGWSEILADAIVTKRQDAPRRDETRRDGTYMFVQYQAQNSTVRGTD
ncbi:hypothetical protein BGZ98_006396, partial [Dissophora globulifera]